MRSILISSVIVFAFFSCQSSDKNQHVRINNQYAIELPALLSPTTDLNDVASLQYSNGEKELYVIVINENKASITQALVDNQLEEMYDASLDGFAQLMLDTYCEGMNVTTITDVENAVINGLEARVVAVEGDVEGVDIYLQIAYIEGKSDYYQLMTWTLLSRKSMFIEQMKTLTHSFREI